VVVIIYTLGLSGCGFSAFALWFYATWKHRLVSPDLPQDEINTRAYTLLITPLVYCASLLLLFVVPLYQPYLICFSWALIGFIARAIRRIYKHWLEKPVQTLIGITEGTVRETYKHWLEKPIQAPIHHEPKTKISAPLSSLQRIWSAHRPFLNPLKPPKTEPLNPFAWSRRKSRNYKQRISNLLSSKLKKCVRLTRKNSASRQNK